MLFLIASSEDGGNERKVKIKLHNGRNRQAGLREDERFDCVTYKIKYRVKFLRHVVNGQHQEKTIISPLHLGVSVFDQSTFSSS